MYCNLVLPLEGALPHYETLDWDDLRSLYRMKYRLCEWRKTRRKQFCSGTKTDAKWERGKRGGVDSKKPMKTTVGRNTPFKKDMLGEVRGACKVFSCSCSVQGHVCTGPTLKYGRNTERLSCLGLQKGGWLFCLRKWMLGAPVAKCWVMLIEHFTSHSSTISSFQHNAACRKPLIWLLSFRTILKVMFCWAFFAVEHILNTSEI